MEVIIKQDVNLISFNNFIFDYTIPNFQVYYLFYQSLCDLLIDI
jgi:hypothetical protein